MIFIIALTVALTGAGALLVHQFRSRAFADDDAPAIEPGDEAIEHRRAA